MAQRTKRKEKTNTQSRLNSAIMFHSTTTLSQISTLLNSSKHSPPLIKRKHCRLPTRHCFPFANHLAPPWILANLIQFTFVKCDLCHPEYSLSSWPFYGWSGRSPEGTTAATGLRRRNTWCCVSAVSRSTSSWTSSMSSSLTHDCRSLQKVLSRTRGLSGVLVSVILLRSQNS